MNIKQTLEQATRELTAAQIDSPTLDAEVMLAHVLKKSKEYLLTHPAHQLPRREQVRYFRLIQKRLKHQPVAYLIGHKEFYSLKIKVNRHVLIPRPATELLVETALQLLPTLKQPLIIEVGTGSGAILAAMAANTTAPKILGTDIYKQALKTAARNLSAFSSRVTLKHGNLLAPARSTLKKHRGDLLIIANLPYLTTTQYQLLAPEVKSEPRVALDGGHDGLKYYRELLIQLHSLDHAYTALFEIDPDQAPTITTIIKTNIPNSHVQIKKDLAGLDRLVILNVVNLTTAKKQTRYPVRH